MVNPEWAPLLHGNPCVDEILLFPRREFRGWRGWRKFLAWCREAVASRQPELALDLQGLFRSAWIGRASGARIVGLSDAREGATWFYDHVTPLPVPPAHSAERYLAAANHALHLYDPAQRPVPMSSLTWPLPSGEAAELPAHVANDGFLLLHPFARGRGKSLSAAAIQQICERVHPQRVVIAGQKHPDPLRSVPFNGINLLNQTSLEQLVWLIRRATFVITVDSGPSHLAAALKRPMIAIHTWSDPRSVGPYWDQAWIWKNGRLVLVQDLPNIEETFFKTAAQDLSLVDIEMISALATSF